MDILTDLASVCFGVFLAALVVIPNLIRVYFELRALKRRGGQQTTSKVLAVYPSPVPFNYPPLVLRETDRPRLEDAGDQDPADWWKDEGPDGP